MFPAPTLLLLPQPPVATVSFYLLSAEGKWVVRVVGRVIREADRVPAEFIFRQYHV